DEKSEEREDENADGGAEVGLVGAAEGDPGREVGRMLVAGVGNSGRETRLQEEQQTGGGDQDGDDRFEGGVGGEQKRDRADGGAEQQGREQAGKALALLAQEVGVADRAADGGGDDADRIGDVGRERRQ